MGSAFLSPLRSCYSETFSLRRSHFCRRILKFLAIVAWGGYFRLCPCLIHKATWGPQRLADTNARLEPKPPYWCYAAPKVVSALRGRTLWFILTLYPSVDPLICISTHKLCTNCRYRWVIICLSQVHSLVGIIKTIKNEYKEVYGQDMMTKWGSSRIWYTAET